LGGDGFGDEFFSNVDKTLLTWVFFWIIEAPRRKQRGAAIRWLADKHQRIADVEANALTGFKKKHHISLALNHIQLSVRF
jgi:hypothetical protein